MISGIFIILLFYAIGEFTTWLIGGFIPGSVIGMILLFAALCLKVVNAELVKPVAKFLTNNMVLFFLPVGVGIINTTDILAQHWQAILTASIVSTVIIIVVVAVIQELFEKRRNKAAKTKTRIPNNI